MDGSFIIVVLPPLPFDHIYPSQSLPTFYEHWPTPTLPLFSLSSFKLLTPMKIQCDVCNKHEASVFCTADEAALCDGCDHRVHHANKLASKHQRFSLLRPSPKQHPLCDICQVNQSTTFSSKKKNIHSYLYMLLCVCWTWIVLYCRREEPLHSVSKTERFSAKSVTCQFTLPTNTPLSTIGSFSPVLNFLLLLCFVRQKLPLIQTQTLLFLTFHTKQHYYLHLPPPPPPPATTTTTRLLLKELVQLVLAAYRSIW